MTEKKTLEDALADMEASNAKAAQPAIDWHFWKTMRTVKLWQACALIVGLDPDTLKPHPQAWMAGPGAGPVFDARSFPNAGTEQRFSKALRLACSAVSYMQGPIFPKGAPHPGNDGEKDVLLSEVGDFFRFCEWPDLPEPLQAILATPNTKSSEPIGRAERTPQEIKELNAMRVPSGDGVSMTSRLRMHDAQEPQAAHVVADGLEKPRSNKSEKTLLFEAKVLELLDKFWNDRATGTRPNKSELCAKVYAELLRTNIRGERGLTESMVRDAAKPWKQPLVMPAFVPDSKFNDKRHPFKSQK